MSPRRNPLSSAAFLIILIHSTLSLTCHPGEYLIGSECCPRCSAGSRVKTHCNEYRSTSCLPCVDGTFTDKPNRLEQCTSCTSCTAGSGLKIKRSCTGTSDSVCEALQGFYCIYSVGDDCEEAQRHSSCGPGQYISRNGTASTDTECSDCRPGTFSDGTSASCQPHTQCEDLNLQLITAGTSAADAQCGPRSDGVMLAVSVAFILSVIVAAGVLFYFRKKVWSKLRALSVFNHRHTNTNSSPKPNRDEERGLSSDQNGSVKERHEGEEEQQLPLSAASHPS